MDIDQLKNRIEALLFTASKPLNIEKLCEYCSDEPQRVNRREISQAVAQLVLDYQGRSIELKETASGYRIQIRQELATVVARLWEEKPQRYSRALLETLALIAYRQPVTRAEIEDVRGVAVSSYIIKTLQEREWIRIVGHRDVPGKPAMFGTTQQFLDYFNLKRLDELPALVDVKNLDSLTLELELEGRGEQTVGEKLTGDIHINN